MKIEFGPSCSAQPSTEPREHTQDDTKRTLKRAVAIIELRGWCQDRFRDFDGRCCIVGAIAEASYENDPAIWNDTELTAKKRVRDHLGLSEVLDLMQWNDAPERKKEEVIAALKAAAA